MSAADLTGGMLDVALQEWAATCRVLELGRTILLVRKGGIHERGGGLFAPEHERFLLMPTWLHQEPTRFAEPFRGVFAELPPAPDGIVPIRLWAQAVRTWRLEELAPLLAIADLLPWTVEELRVRFAYRQPLLHVLALRVYALPDGRRIADRPAYAGCRSWVRLGEQVELAGSRPVIDDLLFSTALGRVSAALDAP